MKNIETLKREISAVKEMIRLYTYPEDLPVLNRRLAILKKKLVEVTK